MNRKIIQKVIDELSKPEPKLDYIRGILETLIEGLPEESMLVPNLPYIPYIPPSYPLPENPLNPPYVVTNSTVDEGAMLDMAAKTALGKMPPIQME